MKSEYIQQYYTVVESVTKYCHTVGNNCPKQNVSYLLSTSTAIIQPS